MKTNTLYINIPVYKTGSWYDEVVYLSCSTKILEVKLPETSLVGYDSTEVSNEFCFTINLN